jgi:predicted nuclease of restriction endonuclease-like (RecB) superfamily
MPNWYAELLESVSTKIDAGRTRAVLSANREAIITYWAVGQDILQRQELAGCGAKVIDQLSVDLQARFPRAKGFSPRNLKYMRAFAWPDPAIVQQAVAELPRGHQIMLLTRLRTMESRLWYAAQAVEHGWSRSVLDVQIDRQAFERSSKAITNFALTLPDEDDLLFFHYKLNRFVVIELKTVRFEPGFLGQLGTYMAAIDDQVKSAHHEPTIGLLLCKTKNALLAEYALRGRRGPMGVAEWTGALETEGAP